MTDCYCRLLLPAVTASTDSEGLGLDWNLNIECLGLEWNLEQ